MPKSFSSLSEFYPYYLSEHQNGTCRSLHFFGSLLVIGVVSTCLATQEFQWIWTALLAGYGPAWIGHFVFEKNRPATFKHPFYSFVSDWLMFKDILLRRIPLLGPLKLSL